MAISGFVLLRFFVYICEDNSELTINIAGFNSEFGIKIALGGLHGKHNICPYSANILCHTVLIYLSM